MHALRVLVANLHEYASLAWRAAAVPSVMSGGAVSRRKFNPHSCRLVFFEFALATADVDFLREAGRNHLLGIVFLRPFPPVPHKFCPSASVVP